MIDHKTILEFTETEMEIKRSRFIGQVYHVETQEAIEAILLQIRKAHYKATHVCYAAVLAPTADRPQWQKASDDGEPSGTAGKPMLEVILNAGLQNILVIVIRYFGGIKLGAGGLVRAYSGCTAQVLSDAPIILKQESDLIGFTVEYSLYGKVLDYLMGTGITPADEYFEDKVTILVYLALNRSPEIIAELRELTNDRFDHTFLDRTFVDIPIKD